MSLVLRTWGKTAGANSAAAAAAAFEMKSRRRMSRRLYALD
jgi:hypothetical protein